MSKTKGFYDVGIFHCYNSLQRACDVGGECSSCEGCAMVEHGHCYVTGHFCWLMA